jgi:hypothetical protein
VGGWVGGRAGGRAGVVMCVMKHLCTSVCVHFDRISLHVRAGSLVCVSSCVCACVQVAANTGLGLETLGKHNEMLDTLKV